jgi:hypothetical protein
MTFEIRLTSHSWAFQDTANDDHFLKQRRYLRRISHRTVASIFASYCLPAPQTKFDGSWRTSLRYSEVMSNDRFAHRFAGTRCA